MRAPTRRNEDGRDREVGKALAAQRRTELAIFEHGLATRYQAETQNLDTQALSDVIQHALEEELRLLSWGIERAAGSPARSQIVAEKVAMFSQINSRRIARRFGS